MTRLYEDLIEGQLSADLGDNSGGTDLTIAAAILASVPEVTGGDELRITLDPEGEAGDPEVVVITAHTTSATTATVTRGAEGTTARAHLTGTPIANALYASDIETLQAAITAGDAANASDISTNTTDIATNAAAIASHGSQHLPGGSDPVGLSGCDLQKTSTESWTDGQVKSVRWDSAVVDTLGWLVSDGDRSVTTPGTTIGFLIVQFQMDVDSGAFLTPVLVVAGSDRYSGAVVNTAGNPDQYIWVVYTGGASVTLEIEVTDDGFTGGGSVMGTSTRLRAAFLGTVV